jgi:hypothetical protein
MDYFGSPAGWVPMLSLEANLQFFENEINTAIPILYLAYWLERVGTDFQGTATALTTAREHLSAEIEDLQRRFQDALIQIPDLKVRRENIVTKVDEVLRELVELEASLLQQAQNDVKKRHKVPAWKKAARVLGAIAKVVPVGQPYLGAIGTGLDLISRVDIHKPMDIIQNIPEIAAAFQAGKFQETADTFAQGFQCVEKCKWNPSCYKDCATNLNAAWNQARMILEDIRWVSEKTQVPQGEVAAELARIKASSPEYASLVEEVQDLEHQKEEFAERLAALTQLVSSLASGITQDMVSIDALNRDLSKTYGRLDHRALQYVSEMKQRTRERLVKYQYYVAKSFEYRLLQRYRGDFTLNNFFDSLFGMIAEPGSGPILAEEQFQLLKGLYVEELSRIVAEVVDYLNRHAPKLSVPVSFGLTRDELAQLNEKGEVTINLFERGLFGNLQENLRIFELLPDSIQVHPAGGPYGSLALLRLRFEHSGLSRLQDQGQIYRFQHYRTSAVNPITWEATYDGRTGNVTYSEPSIQDESLIRYLLELNGRPFVGLLSLYSLPAAWADIVVRKEVSTDNGVDMVIDDLNLTLTYEYQAKRADQAELAVTVADGHMPAIFLDHPDVNDRQDGIGSIRRVFSPHETVAIQAQEVYGEYCFARWTDRFGRNFGPDPGNPNLSITLDSPLELRAIYRYGMESGGVFIRGDANADGRVNLSDAVKTLGVLFLGDPSGFPCGKAADTNDTGVLDITDAVFLLNYLFLGKVEPPSPFPACGEDRTIDTLGCVSYPACGS